MILDNLELVIFRSGDDDGPFRGFLVGESWLITISVELSRALTISAPRFSAVSSWVKEYHEAHCALKSPITRISPE